MTRLLILAMATLALAGCGSDAPLPTAGPVSVYTSSGEGGNSALFEGDLKMTDGCLVVEAEGGEQIVPVFPDAATWADGKLTFRGEEYDEGSSVSLGGGFGGVPSAYVPEACSRDLTWVVHQDTDSLTE